VGVVAAQVSDARHPALVGQVSALGHRQRVGVGAKPDAGGAGAQLEPADDTGPADALGHVVAPFAQHASNVVGGLGFLEGQARVLVQEAEVFAKLRPAGRHVFKGCIQQDSP